MHPMGEHVYTDIRGRCVFALRVYNDSMEPEFREGDVVVVLKDADVISDDFVIVAFKSENRAALKQLKLYGNKSFLHPLNPKYPDIELDHKKEHRIVGKVMEKIKKY